MTLCLFFVRHKNKPNSRNYIQIKRDRSYTNIVSHAVTVQARQWMVSSHIELQITCHAKFDQDPSVCKCVANRSLIDKNGVTARCEQLTSNYRQFGTKIHRIGDYLARKGDCFEIVLQTFVANFILFVAIVMWIFSEHSAIKSLNILQIVLNMWQGVRQFIYFFNLAFANSVK